MVEGKGIVIIQIPSSKLIIPCWPAYYSPSAPNNIIGLPAIKSHLQFRSVRTECLDWIRFVDKSGNAIRINFSREKHRKYLLDFFEVAIIHPITNAQHHQQHTIKALLSKDSIDWVKIHRRLSDALS